MVLKAAARAAGSHPLATGDHGVGVEVPKGGSWGGVGVVGGTPWGGAVRRAGVGGQEALGAWPGHKAMVPVQSL